MTDLNGLLRRLPADIGGSSESEVSGFESRCSGNGRGVPGFQALTIRKSNSFC